MAETSTKPYLMRAIHEWCVDNGYRPYIAVAVDETTIVPREFVRNGEIVLNVSVEACNRLRMGNDLIEFEARFNRVVRQVSIPVDKVTAVYAAETGQGMAFEVVMAPQAESSPESEASADPAPASAARSGPTLVQVPAPDAKDDAEAPPLKPARAKRAPRTAKAVLAADTADPSKAADAASPAAEKSDAEAPPAEPPSPPSKGRRPTLTRVK